VEWETGYSPASDVLIPEDLAALLRGPFAAIAALLQGYIYILNSALFTA
jgi:hypothetical protein